MKSLKQITYLIVPARRVECICSTDKQCILISFQENLNKIVTLILKRNNKKYFSYCILGVWFYFYAKILHCQD